MQIFSKSVHDFVRSWDNFVMSVRNCVKWVHNFEKSAHNFFKSVHDCSMSVHDLVKSVTIFQACARFVKSVRNVVKVVHNFFQSVNEIFAILSIRYTKFFRKFLSVHEIRQNNVQLSETFSFFTQQDSVLSLPPSWIKQACVCPKFTWILFEVTTAVHCNKFRTYIHQGSTGKQSDL